MDDIFSGKEAGVRFERNDFSVVSPGDFVRCAYSGSPIRLSELMYWSFERQEPYKGAAEAFAREEMLSGSVQAETDVGTAD